MTRLLALQLLLSFLVGGSFVAACTAAADRFGTNVGGVIGGFPSTAAVGLLSIGLVCGPGAAVEATGVVPLVMGVNGMFLVVFAVLAGRGFGISLAGALLFWFLASLGIVRSGFRSFPGSVLAFLVLLPTSYLLFQHALKIPAYKGRRVRLTVAGIVPRAVLSGLVIATAVLLSRASGPVVGGVFATFPAAFLSAVVIAFRARGPDFARALAKPLMLSGLVNVFAYAVAVRVTYPALGLLGGTLVAFAVSLLTAYGTYRLVVAIPNTPNRNE